MAASPPKKKRSVPLTVRLLGIGIFFGVGLVGCVIVYSAFLYFGVSDLFGIKDYFPKWVVAESLRQKQAPSKNTRNPDADAKSIANGQNANSPDAKQPNLGSADSTGNPTVADNGTPPSGNPDAKGPQKTGADDVAAPSPAKANPATNPFNNPKPNDA